jgi:hypothetical protein
MKLSDCSPLNNNIPSQKKLEKVKNQRKELNTIQNLNKRSKKVGDKETRQVKVEKLKEKIKEN